MRIYLDTNILLDIIHPNRSKEFKVEAVQLVDTCRALGFDMFMSVLSVPTVFYLLKGLSLQEKKDAFATIQKYVSVLPSNGNHVQAALKSNFSDFEDAMQYECALEGACDLIITRNEKDFASSEKPVVTPKEFLAEVLG